jgi:hypothetical protein
MNRESIPTMVARMAMAIMAPIGRLAREWLPVAPSELVPDDDVGAPAPVPDPNSVPEPDVPRPPEPVEAPVEPREDTVPVPVAWES